MAALEDRVCVVTGAGRGIGAAVARLLASEGGKVVVNDLGVNLDGTGGSQGPAEETVDEIRRAGGTASVNFGSVADHAAAERLIHQAIEEYGKLDVLVNVAGILRDRMIFNMTEAEWDAVIAVHLKGTFNTSKFASQYWHDTRGGNYRLINFTSVSGLHGAPGQPNYAAAKMGIVGLTLSCANALGRYGVTANCISPGAATRMTESVPTERRRSATADSDERAPENVAPAVAYLASTRSGWITGRVIHASGYQISLYSNPEPVRVIAGTGPWELDRAFELIERTFRPAIEPGSRYGAQPPQQAAASN
jgi:NAD(P)-dependent dehydrogenase (short-subunit alcohol dehydrogenase family)